MKKSAFEFVDEYLKREAGDFYDSNSFEECFKEWIGWEDDVYSESVGSSRWWDNLFCVSEVDGVLIGYGWAATTGDNNIFDVGWEFDKSTICYVEKKEVTTTKYIRAKD